MKLENIDRAIVIWGPVSQEALSQREETTLFVVPEQRPSLLGLRQVAPSLRYRGMQYVCCSDNTVGFLFYKGKIEKTLLFCKKINEESAVGPPGSLYIAMLSKLHNVPVEAVFSESNFQTFDDKDASTLGGKDFILEENRETYIIESSDEILPREVLG